MKKGHLSQYFSGIVYKRLSAVEADVSRSNQHEFNGVQQLIDLLGRATDKVRLPATFYYFDDDNGVETEGVELTWYDARAKHTTRTEHRLYFPKSTVSEKVAEGDLLIMGKRSDEDLVVIIAQAGTTAERQIAWLFGIKETARTSFTAEDERVLDGLEVSFIANSLLEELGVVIEPATDDFLDIILEKFGEKLPTTRIFSEFARGTFKGELNPTGDLDTTLMQWMAREEHLFRLFEKHILKERLEDGFGDVDDFISFSLSVQNRRKSRAGHALENHLEQIFTEAGVSYSRGKVTENNAKPDFIFPSIENYHDESFPAESLHMLGAKSTCKDRWRQVLSEAARIPKKHLLTLEPSISKNQTDEMKSNDLQLVLPQEVFSTYTEEQRSWLMNLKDFVEVVKSAQP